MAGWDQDRFCEPESIDENVVCGICTLVCRDAMQCQEQHPHCAICINKWLAEGSGSCPLRHPLSNAGLQPSRIVRNMVHKYKVKCSFVAHGCEQMMMIAAVESHEASCEFRQVPCDNASSGCVFIACHNQIPEHLEVCDFADVGCPRCEDHFLRKDSQGHDCVVALARQLRAEREKQRDVQIMYTLHIHDLEERVRLGTSATALGSILKYALCVATHSNINKQ